MSTKDFENEVDKLLTEEAKRVFNILWEMTEKRIKKNKSYTNLVYDTISDNYKCYHTTILDKICKLIPLGWIINCYSGCVFITNEEWLYRYNKEKEIKRQNCLKNNNKIINNIVDSIVCSYENNQLNDKSLFYFFNNYQTTNEKIDYDDDQLNELFNNIIQKLNTQYKILKISPLQLQKL